MIIICNNQRKKFDVRLKDFFFCWLNNIHLCWKTVNENHQIVDATDQLSIINYDDDLDIHWLINEKEKIIGNQYSVCVCVLNWKNVVYLCLVVVKVVVAVDKQTIHTHHDTNLYLNSR